MPTIVAQDPETARASAALLVKSAEGVVREINEQYAELTDAIRKEQDPVSREQLRGTRNLLLRTASELQDDLGMANMDYPSVPASGQNTPMRGFGFSWLIHRDAFRRINAVEDGAHPFTSLPTAVFHENSPVLTALSHNRFVVPDEVTAESVFAEAHRSLYPLERAIEIANGATQRPEGAEGKESSVDAHARRAAHSVADTLGVLQVAGEIQLGALADENRDLLDIDWSEANTAEERVEMQRKVGSTLLRSISDWCRETAAAATERVRPLAENVAERAGEIRDRLVESTAGARERLAESTAGARERFAEGALEIRDRLVESAGDVTRRATEALRDAGYLPRPEREAHELPGWDQIAVEGPAQVVGALGEGKNGVDGRTAQDARLAAETEKQVEVPASTVAEDPHQAGLTGTATVPSDRRQLIVLATKDADQLRAARVLGGQEDGEATELHNGDKEVAADGAEATNRRTPLKAALAADGAYEVEGGTGVDDAAGLGDGQALEMNTAI